MDQYTYLLCSAGNFIQANKLAEDLIRLGENRPEGYVAMASYLETKGDLKTAVGYVDRAISLDREHAQAYVVKGSLLLSLNRPVEAISAFRVSHRLSRNVVTYRGLMECYLSLNRLKEALSMAKESVMLMPQSARALTLVGIVLSHMPNGAERARMAFNKALAVDPKCGEAVIALVGALNGEQKFDESIKILENCLNYQNSHLFHTRLAEVCILAKNYDKANDHFNTALTLNPEYEVAREGLVKLEKIIGGIDETEDEDEEGEEDGGEEEEMEGVEG
ncbi:Anaphase-promoting complex subunit 7 [Chytridiales sp. JEL 0842]|nr:Anaphase-promoting complex subunit 7 [Chytridiales sp. JEL 0842]